MRKFLKRFWQRGKRGWSDADAWDPCSYLTRVNKEMLTKLMSGCTYPSNMKLEQWQEILKTVLLGWEAKERQLDFGGNWEADQEIFLRGMELYVKYFDDLWD